MKTIKFFAVAAALIGMVACCDKAPKQFDGFIADASMNTVTVKALTSDSTQTFTTEGADMSEANGLLIGSPVIVDYIGKLEATTPATKVTTDATYANAIGEWTMADPLNDSLRMGINLQIQGAAQSINMATLQYNAWELQGEAGKILLKGQSIGNGQTIDFTETAVISQDANGVSTLKIDSTEVVLTKGN